MNLFSYNSPLWNTVNKALHLLWLSILWVVCSIPVITIGASTTALYTVCLKYVKNQEGYLTSSFLRAMKENFRQATIIWLIFVVVGCILGVDLAAYFRAVNKGTLQVIMLTIFISMTLAYILSGLYVFALQAKFDNTIRRTILNSMIMALRHWPVSLTMLISAFAILVFGMRVFPPILFFSPGLLCYINSRFMVKVFEKYVPAEELSREE